MENELVKVYEYELSKDVIEKCKKEERDIQSIDVENEIHEILKDNNIEFKNKIEEGWRSKIGTQKKIKEFYLFVEVYVKKSDYIKAKELIDEYLK